MNPCKIDGEEWIIPLNGFSEIGGVVGIGQTQKEAIDNCKKHAEGIKGDSLEIKLDSLDDAVEELAKIKEG